VREGAFVSWRLQERGVVLRVLFAAGGLLLAHTAFAGEAPAMEASPTEHVCLALAIYHEARGEPLEGRIAVAMTVLNRVASRAYPDTICGVVFQNMRLRNACQFTFACNGRSLTPKNARAFARSAALARIVLERAVAPDAFAGDYFLATMRRYAHVTHYHRVDVKPAWSARLVAVRRVGDHLFLASPRVLNRMPVRLVSARAEKKAHPARPRAAARTRPASGRPITPAGARPPFPGA
jgi:hypothetical protein